MFAFDMIPAGFDTEGLSSAVWPGGETEALTRLERHLERKVSQTQIITSFLNISLDMIRPTEIPSNYTFLTQSFSQPD